ncbi:EAL domain-containing protein [Thermotoga sp. SG1]|uniref:EAL domain-containing protein n=1 Tax=Thermotoga sp. SG1 TaxID=126739 RepID=UPI000C785188|nr:EAL domain-containing protein [Thermotoga sp. SG1]PLV56062.1 hypothetical protein AS006_05720 [Thermotoga sp. SG1]
MEHLETSVVEHLKKKRFKIVIDDFGTGFSSLKRLAELRPDIIKIDMSLIGNVHKDWLKRHMIEALFSAASKSGIQVIAEGVETTEEYETLQKIGIELM